MEGNEQCHSRRSVTLRGFYLELSRVSLHMILLLMSFKRSCVEAAEQTVPKLRACSTLTDSTSTRHSRSCPMSFPSPLLLS